MKFIDEKGRLFGIINPIDFLAILFLIGIIPVIFFGYKIIMQKPVRAPSDSYEVILKCELVKLKPEVTGLISIGDKELDSKKYEIGKIMELGPDEPYGKDTFLRQRSAALKLRLQNKGSDLFYKDRLVDYKSELVFNTGKYALTAVVEDRLIKMLKLKVTLKELDNDTVKLIKVGDKELDVYGRVVVEIIKVGLPTESSFEVDLNRGKFTVGKVIGKEQITTEMVLRCQEILNKIYFKGKPLTYDLPIEVVTDKYTVKGFLAKPYEITPSNNPNYPFESSPSERSEEY